jgi:hypothetical protein
VVIQLTLTLKCKKVRGQLTLAQCSSISAHRTENTVTTLFKICRRPGQGVIGGEGGEGRDGGKGLFCQGHFSLLRLKKFYFIFLTTPTLKGLPLKLMGKRELGLWSLEND